MQVLNFTIVRLHLQEGGGGHADLDSHQACEGLQM